MPFMSMSMQGLRRLQTAFHSQSGITTFPKMAIHCVGRVSGFASFQITTTMTRRPTRSNTAKIPVASNNHFNASAEAIEMEAGVKTSVDPTVVTTTTTRYSARSRKTVKKDVIEDYDEDEEGALEAEVEVDEPQVKPPRTSKKRMAESVDQSTKEHVEAFNAQRVKKGSLREVAEIPIDILFEVCHCPVWPYCRFVPNLTFHRSSACCSP